MKKARNAFRRGFAVASMSSLGLLSSLAFGADDELSLTDLLDLTVTTATRSAVRLVDAPAVMTVITKDEIERYGYRNLSEALQRVPEVYRRFEGHNWGNDFRGFFTNNTRRQVLFLLNGHRINDRFHFGDFYPDVFADLANVERIEVLRGPGAVLYGNNAILGVVNIITKNAKDLADGSPAQGDAKIAYEEFTSDGGFAKIQASFLKKFSATSSLTADISYLKGDTLYDSKTTWDSERNGEGPGKSKYHVQHDFYTSITKGSKGNNSFKGGSPLPNIYLNYDFSDFGVGFFNYTRQTSWIPPRDNMSFGDEENIRSWGVSTAYFDYKPQSGTLQDLGFRSRLSYNLNANREASSFSAELNPTVNAGTPPVAISLFQNRVGQITQGAGAAQRFIKSGDSFVLVGSDVSEANLNALALANGGGGGYGYYAGLDQTVGWEFELTPYKSDTMRFSLGGNYEAADYENQQWMTDYNGDFLGYYRFGGISDKGWYYGIWSQLIWNVVPNFTLTLGGRYDYQKIEDVYRNFGGDKMYTRDADGNYIPVARRDNVASNFSPRVAMNYRLNEDTNFRLILATAFRAVPPQETIRLSQIQGNVPSEKANDVEFIGSHTLAKQWNVNYSYFQINNNRNYVWNPEAQNFLPGAGYSNKGGTLGANFVIPQGSYWGSLSQMYMKRPTGDLGFGDKPLDTPMSLVKLGGSYRLPSKLTLAGEVYNNGPTTGIQRPAGSSTPPEEIKAKGSTYADVNVTQDFANYGYENLDLGFKILNVLDSEVVYQLSPEGQNHNTAAYERPGELPGFGRQFVVTARHKF